MTYKEFFEQVVVNGGVCPNLKTTEDNTLSANVHWWCDKLGGECDTIKCPFIHELVTDPASAEQLALIAKLKKALG